MPDAREAIEWLRFAAGRYGIVILDVSAATPGSVAFLTWLRAKYPHMTTVMLNNQRENIPFEPARMPGGTVPVWQKPLSDAEFRVVETWTREHFLRGGIANVGASSSQAA